MHELGSVAEDFGQRLDDRRIELRTPAAAQLGDRELVAATGTKLQIRNNRCRR
jgi:hypothetical protein